MLTALEWCLLASLLTQCTRVPLLLLLHLLSTLGTALGVGSVLLAALGLAGLLPGTGPPPQVQQQVAKASYMGW